MLSKDQAIYYKEQLHPAFAGYIYDGTIAADDLLALIFCLIDQGVIVPEWKDRNLRNKISSVKLTAIKPKFDFEQKVIDVIFAKSKTLTASELGEFLRSNVLHQILIDNINAIAAFPIIGKELRFDLGKGSKVEFELNGNKVDTIEEAKYLKNILRFLFIPVFGFVGLTIIISALSVILGDNKNLESGSIFTATDINFSIQNEGNPWTLLLVGLFFIMVPILGFYVPLVKSNKVLKYKFEKKIIPLARKKYSELYEFLKSRPLNNHRVTNEFLAYSVAFGLDESFNADFGIISSFKLDKTSMTEHVN